MTYPDDILFAPIRPTTPVALPEADAQRRDDENVTPRWLSDMTLQQQSLNPPQATGALSASQLQSLASPVWGLGSAVQNGALSTSSQNWQGIGQPTYWPNNSSLTNSSLSSLGSLGNSSLSNYTANQAIGLAMDRLRQTGSLEDAARVIGLMTYEALYD